METIRDILMNSTDEDLSILAGFIIDIKEKEINTLNDQIKRYQFVNDLMASFQIIGRNFFYAKMEYGDVVRKLAENMEVTLDKKSNNGIDFIEVAIAKKYIIKNLKYISDERKTELIKILGFNSSAVNTDYKNVINMLADDLSDSVTFRVISWLANTTLQSFLGNDPELDEEGIIFYGRKEFREQVVYPILHVAMLRHKYRYNQVPKCTACTAVIVQGAKFCNECGAKL